MLFVNCCFCCLCFRSHMKKSLPILIFWSVSAIASPSDFIVMQLVSNRFCLFHFFVIFLLSKQSKCVPLYISFPSQKYPLALLFARPMYKKLSLCLSFENVLIFLFSWRIFSLGMELRWQLLSALENTILIPYSLSHFLWEILSFFFFLKFKSVFMFLLLGVH